MGRGKKYQPEQAVNQSDSPKHATQGTPECAGFFLN